MQNPFPGLDKYWNKRHLYFSRWDEGIKTDAEGLYSVTPEAVAEEIAKRIESGSVLDAFTGIGGSAIPFAKAGKKVVAVDNNCDRLRMAEHNAGIYGVADRITFVCDDVLDRLAVSDCDAAFLDPPWGGPGYKKKDVFRLDDFSVDGRILLRLALDNFDEVLLRVPANFEVSELDDFGGFDLRDDVLEGDVISRTVHFRISVPG